jgi:predicted Zn finger-like uncharacterized protein
MALATQCPHCQTTFRVAQDQLKLRSGLVRCGSCKQIFNGIENLLRPEEPAQAPAPDIQPPAPPSAEQSPLPPASAVENEIRIDAPAIDVAPDDSPASAGPATETQSEPETKAADDEQERIADDAEVNDDPLLRMTLMDFAHLPRQANDDEEPHIPHTGPEEPDPIDQAIDDLQRRPWRAEPQESTDETDDELDRAESADYEEPSFVKQGRRRQRMGRILRVVLGTGTVILLITLLGQGAYVFRDQIAARFPQTKPLLATACDHLGCHVGLPSEIDAVSIESNELQALAAGSDTFALSVLLRNHGSTDQTWPHIELTLNDNSEKPIVRRAFSPREYLGAEYDPRQGFRARSEQPVKLYFQLAQLKASGYRVYVFYP